MNKQTQTKMFDFSDPDLDFCAGSKNKFPDVFKKMLANGYNSKVVSSVSIAGDQVTLDYGVNHGYKANRVLAINTTGLSGEFYIDSVTSNTLILTVPNAPASIAGGFTTKVAPLGWELVYEQANIHIYKLKSIDESELFLRLCFQGNAGYRNRVAPCIGKSADLSTGVITDVNALSANKSITAPAVFSWEFNYQATSIFNNYTATQGVGFGKGLVIGSMYHLVIFTNSANETYDVVGATNALLPSSCLNYDSLNAPVLLGASYDNRASDGRVRSLDIAFMYINNIPVRIQASKVTSDSIVLQTPLAQSSFLPPVVDSFNTTACYPMPLFHRGTGQFLGYALGLYIAAYGGANAPSTTRSSIPLITQDIDFDSRVIVHQSDWNSPDGGVWFAAPVEEVKIAS